MSALAQSLPRSNQMQRQFLDLLEERKAHIASFVLLAWDGETAEIVNAYLQKAQIILHQIAGSASTLGYAELCATTLHCEARIIAHLDGPYADLAICPGEILWFIDTFVEACDSIADLELLH